MKNILLIITGSIASYKSLELISGLNKLKKYNITCVMTESAKKFITPLAVSSMTSNHTYIDLFSLKDEVEMGHIKLARNCDLIVVAPATANFIGKIATGIADDLASAIIMARGDKKLFIAPAMNSKMWENEILQHNIATLGNSKNINIIEPDSGELACGEYGIGKMKEVSYIVEYIDNYFSTSSELVGKKILVNGGATREQIDPVRFISNHSSGKQAVEIARSFARKGADVKLVLGYYECDLPKLPNIDISFIKTSDDMFDEIDNMVTHNKFDVAILVAAVSDYRVENIEKHKIKKSDKINEFNNIKFVETKDILKAVSNHKNRPQIVVGFAAETNDIIENAKKKLVNKNCDYIILNNVENGNVFGGEENKIFILSKVEEGDKVNMEEWQTMPKKEVAEKLVNKITSDLIKAYK